eukprot:Rmarinus@m.7860
MGLWHRIWCFCEGGKKCRFENHKKQKGESAVDGLHSSWVNEWILAMARPNQKDMVAYSVVDQFVKENITAIINLQEPGEHKACGNGVLHHTGFSYDPSKYMENKISHYNFCWVDMGVPSMSLLLRAVQVMHYHRLIHEKVAVHCHSGLGRTGVVIAAYLVYADGLSPEEAITVVRAGRKGAIQTKKQQACIYTFQDYIERLRRVFHDDLMRSNLPSLAELISNQRKYLHGNELRVRYYVPKIVDEVCKRLVACVHDGSILPHEVVESMQQFPKYSDEVAEEIQLVKVEINASEWGLLYSEVRVDVLVGLLLGWLIQLKEAVIDETALRKLLELSHAEGAVQLLLSGEYVQSLSDAARLTSHVTHTHMHKGPRQPGDEACMADEVRQTPTSDPENGSISNGDGLVKTEGEGDGENGRPTRAPLESLVTDATPVSTQDTSLPGAVAASPITPGAPDRMPDLSGRPVESWEDQVCSALWKLPRPAQHVVHTIMCMAINLHPGISNRAPLFELLTSFLIHRGSAWHSSVEHARRAQSKSPESSDVSDGQHLPEADIVLLGALMQFVAVNWIPSVRGSQRGLSDRTTTQASFFANQGRDLESSLAQLPGR